MQNGVLQYNFTHKELRTIFFDAKKFDVIDTVTVGPAVVMDLCCRKFDFVLEVEGDPDRRSFVFPVAEKDLAVTGLAVVGIDLAVGQLLETGIPAGSRVGL